MGAPPSNQHRTEMLEQGLGDLSFSISEQTTAAVNSAFQKMQQTLIDHLSLSIDQAFQRFEARIAKSLEQQDVSMNTLKDVQLKSQEERRSSISSLRDTETTKRFGGTSSGVGSKGLVDVQGEREVMGRPGSTITLTNPAPPHLFHLTEPPPSMPSYIYITELYAQQVFEVILERNSVLIDETFNTTLTTVGKGFVGSGGHCSTLTSRLSDKHDKVVKVNTPHQLARFDKRMVYKFHENEYGKAHEKLYRRFNNLTNAFQVFDELPIKNKIAWMTALLRRVKEFRDIRGEVLEDKTVVSWNSMLSCYAHNGDYSEVFRIFERMQIDKCCANEYTAAMLLSVCAKLGDLDMGCRVKSFIHENKSCTNIRVSTALSKMFAKCGDIDEARRVFDQMVGRDVVAWSAMSASYAPKGRSSEALELFGHMKHQRIKPNDVTIVTVLSACARLGSVEAGESIESFVESKCFDSELRVASALLELLKLGLHFFDMIRNKPIKQVLKLQNCRFTRNITEEMSKLTALASIDIAQKNSEGELPSRFGNILVMECGQINQSGNCKELLMAGTTFEQLVNAHENAIPGLKSSCEHKMGINGIKDSNSGHLNKGNSDTEISMKHLPGVQLTEEEEKEIDNVGWKSILDYILISKGTLFPCYAVLSHLGCTGLQAAASIWLAFGVQVLEKNLLLDNVYKSEDVYAAPIRVFQFLYNTGDVKVPQTVAFNLPNDERIAKGQGSSMVMLKNVSKAKLKLILRPIADEVFNRWGDTLGEALIVGSATYTYTMKLRGEEVETIAQKFPSFDLEDKVVLWERGNAMDWPKLNGLLNFKKLKHKKQAQEELEPGE